MDWDLDDKVEAAAPEPVEDDQPEAYADEEQPEAYYAEDDQPGLYAEDNRPEVHAQDLDSEDDSQMSAPMEVDDGYRDTAYAAPQPAPEGDAQPFDVEAFVAETTRRLDAVRAAPEPYKYRPADTAASQSAWSSPHRDPVVRGDPMKEDPLDVITALAEKYSKPLPQASYGRANTVAPPAPPAPMPPRQLAEVQDDSGDEIDFRAAFDDAAPEVETVEVADRAVALADDLDIPELALDEELPPVSAYDDLDAEFASLLNDMNGAEPAAPRTSGYDDDFADDSRAPARPYQAETKAAPAAARHASTIPGYDDEPDQYAFDADDLPGSHSLEGAQYGPDEFDYDPGFDEAIPGPAMAAAASRPKPQRRGMLVAAIVGGVAIVGGLGAFALSFGDGSSDTPAIVMADDGPVKVKPENPGGTTVPNQDNKVYDTVAGQGSTAEPQQEKLVTTSEEPMDMTPPAVAPAGEDMAAGALPKGEDRIEQILQEAENQTDTEIAAVAPRKVRTMVVKPDGTLVPRDEPEPAQAALPADQPETAAPAQDMAIATPAPESTGALPTTVPESEQILTPPAAEAPVAAETPAPAPAAVEPPAPAPEMQAAAPAPEMQAAAPAPESQAAATAPEAQESDDHARHGADCAAAPGRSADRRRRRGQGRPGRVRSYGRRGQHMVDADRVAAERSRRAVLLSGSRAPLRKRARRPRGQHRQGRDRRQGHILARARAGQEPERRDQPLRKLQGCRRQLLRIEIASVRFRRPSEQLLPNPARQQCRAGFCLWPLRCEGPAIALELDAPMIPLGPETL